ncbi:MAG: hypothetical protein Q4C72_01945 [Eubacteriales bacterium]|nr:hypothetical protein [Eubacteriales bacterium]
MRRNRILAALTAAMLLLGLPPSAFAAPREGEAVPQVTVQGTRVTGGKYFELGLRVKTEAFQSVGAVLSYDPDQLVPVDWTAGAAAAVGKGSWDNSTAMLTRGADGLAGKPALAYRDETAGGRAYLYLGADSLVRTDLSAETQVVTVRFAYVGETKQEDITVPGTQDASAPYTVELAEGEAARASIPGASAVLTQDADTVWQTEDENRPLEVAFRLTDGEGIATPGGGGMTGAYAVTLFDWDGTVVDAICADADASEALQTAQGKLTGKPGYAFDRWLVVTQGADGLQTAYGTFSSNDAPLAADCPDAVDPANIAARAANGYSLLLQAAYKAKTAENGFDSDLVNAGLDSNAARYYTISEPVYTRYGAADSGTGQYSLTMHAYRRNRADGADYGVTRLKRPAVVVVMRPVEGTQNIVSLIELKNADDAVFEVVPTKAIASVSYKVVDLDGVTNWPGAAAKSDPDLQKDKATFVKQGSLGYLADQAYAVWKGGEWETYVDAQLLADAGFAGKNLDGAKAALAAKTGETGRKLTNAEVTAALQGV